MSIVKINPFKPRPSHSTTESQSFRHNVKILGRSAVAAGPEKKNRQVSKPLATALVSIVTFPYTVRNTVKDTVFHKLTHIGHEKWTSLPILKIRSSIVIVNYVPLCAAAVLGVFPYA